MYIVLMKGGLEQHQELIDRVVEEFLVELLRYRVLVIVTDARSVS